MLIQKSVTSPAGFGNRAYRVVLRNLGGFHPYVVHYQGMDDLGDYWRGDYNETLLGALLEFQDRCRSRGLVVCEL